MKEPKLPIFLEKKNYFELIKYYKTINSFGLEKGQYYEEFEAFCPNVYFPNEISVYENGVFVESISVLDKNNFMLITDTECECG